jgi:hypothetical protein
VDHPYPAQTLPAFSIPIVFEPGKHPDFCELVKVYLAVDPQSLIVP